MKRENRGIVLRVNRPLVESSVVVMFVSLGIPQTYKAIATSHLSQRYINLHLWRRNIYNHSSRVHYFPHCTVTTERHHVERGATSRQEEHKSPTEKNIESFLAEKGYKVEDSVILFDGECNLCNGSVNFVLDHDKEGIFKVGGVGMWHNLFH